MTLILVSCAWIAGILIGSRLDLAPLWLLVGLAPLPGFWLLRHRRKQLALVAVCLFLVLAGIVRYPAATPVPGEGDLEFYNDSGTVTVTGVVADAPEAGAKTTHLRLSVREITAARERREVSGVALLFVPPYPVYAYGDSLSVTGKLSTPPQLDDFDYAAYLARRGVTATMLYPDIEVRATDQGFPPLAWVHSLRGRLAGALAEVLPEPQASLAQGVLLGMRSSIPETVEDDFARSGTAHLLAISGLHVTIIAGLVLGIAARIFGRRRHLHVWLALTAVWLYALLAGMQAPVSRAAIMASLFLLAELLGRQRSTPTALAFAAALMVAVNPTILWEASFQLSFVAMLGLVTLGPRLQSLGQRAAAALAGDSDNPVVGGIGGYLTDNLAVTLGVIIAVWPVIAYYFGIVSWVAPLATLLALPALPWVLISGGLAAGLGIIALPLGQAAGWIAWVFISYLIAVTGGLASLPGAASETVHISPVAVAGYYLALLAAIVLWRNRHLFPPLPSASLITSLPKKWLLPPLLAAAVASTVAAASLPDDKLHVTFLNVGQGDAVLIRTPAGNDILIDGGPNPGALSTELGRQMPFWDRTIDLVILTHPHADHLTGLLEVLRRYRVEQVVYPAVETDSPLYDEWLRLIDEAGIRHTVARAGQRIDLGGGNVIELLNPPRPPLSGTESDIDNNGVVVRVSAGSGVGAGVSFLLMADTMLEAERSLIRRRAGLASTVLKVGHHGSNTSTGADLLATVDPLVAVISVGEDNRFGHPTSEVTERLMAQVGEAGIYRTDEDGAIEFITDGHRLWVKTDSP